MKAESDGQIFYDIARYLSASSMSFAGISASKKCAFEAPYNTAKIKVWLKRNRLLSFIQMSFMFLD
jgi:hypothetical protein